MKIKSLKTIIKKMSNLKKYETMLNDSLIQKEMHLPSGKPNDLNDKNNHLYSVHGNSKKKTLWYRSSWESMSSSNVPTNPDLVTYRSKMFPFHALHKSILTTITPKIKAKDGYEIRFCDNLFVSMIKEFRLFFNDTELQFGNEKSLFFHLNLCENRKRLFEELGNKNQIIKAAAQVIDPNFDHPYAWSSLPHELLVEAYELWDQI